MKGFAPFIEPNNEEQKIDGGKDQNTMTNAELASLAQRMKDGDETAFSQLYEEMWKPLCYIASKQLNSREEAMDVVQDTLVVVYQDIHKLKDNMAFSAWMNRILYAKCAAVVGTKKRKPLLPLDEISEAQFVDQLNLVPEEWLFNQEASSSISRMVSDLPEEQRAAIILYYYSQLSTKEIAKVMNLSTNAVTIKLSRARGSLKKKIEKMIQKGDFLYSMMPVSILTRFLMAEAEQVCTMDMKDLMWKRIQLGIEATAATAGAATAGSKTISTTGTKIGLGLVSVVTISGLIWAGVYLQTTAQSPKAQVAGASLTAATTEPPITTATTEVQEYGSLPWMVGEQDAQTIISFTSLGQDNRNPDFKGIVHRHQMELEEYYFDQGDENSMYVLFTLTKESKKLILCEFYNAKRTEWSVKYEIYDQAYPNPQTASIKSWFQDH